MESFCHAGINDLSLVSTQMNIMTSHVADEEKTK